MDLRKNAENSKRPWTKYFDAADNENIFCFLKEDQHFISMYKIHTRGSGQTRFSSMNSIINCMAKKTIDDSELQNGTLKKRNFAKNAICCCRIWIFSGISQPFIHLLHHIFMIFLVVVMLTWEKKLEQKLSDAWGGVEKTDREMPN